MDSELWNGMFPTVLVSCKQQGQHAFLGWGVSDLKVTLPYVCVCAVSLPKHSSQPHAPF